MNPSDLLAEIAMRSQIMQEAARSQEATAPASEPEADQSSPAVAEPERDPAAIVALGDAAWADWLRGLEPDSLVVLLVGAPEALRERVVASLDDESQQWLHDNLAMLTRVTKANARQAWDHAWAVYDELDLPERPADEPTDDGATAGLPPAIADLIDAAAAGDPGWSQRINGLDDQLLMAGLTVAAVGLPEAQVLDQLTALAEEHLAQERARVRRMQAVVEAVLRRESSPVVATRLQQAGG